MLAKSPTEKRRCMERLMHPRKVMPTFESLLREYVQVSGLSAHKALNRLSEDIEHRYDVQVSFGALRKYYDGTSRVPTVILFTAIVGTLLELPE